MFLLLSLKLQSLVKGKKLEVSHDIHSLKKILKLWFIILLQLVDSMDINVDKDMQL
jgi:hypothetical protein